MIVDDQDAHQSSVRRLFGVEDRTTLQVRCHVEHAILMRTAAATQINTDGNFSSTDGLRAPGRARSADPADPWRRAINPLITPDEIHWAGHGGGPG